MHGGSLPGKLETSMNERLSMATDGEVFAEIPAKFDLAVRFGHIRPGFPVLFYAGYADESLTSRIAKEGLGSAASKPFILNELAGAIRDRLSGAEQRPVLL